MHNQTKNNPSGEADIQGSREIYLSVRKPTRVALSINPLAIG